MRRHRRRLLRHGVPLSLPKCAARRFFASRTRATTVRHRRDCFLEWKLRLLLLHCGGGAGSCNDTTWTNRRRRRRHGPPRRRRLFVLDAGVRASERASELVRPSTVRLLHCTPLLPPLFLSRRSTQSSAAYQLVHDYCNRAVKDQLDGRPRLKTLTIFSSF